MRAGFVTFEGMTSLDLLGALDPVARLGSLGFMADLELDLCAPSAEVRDSNGLVFRATSVGVSLSGLDLVVVPGGPSTRTLVRDAGMVDWIRTASRVPIVASVCTGSLLLGAAGFLEGRPATTHKSALDLLAEYAGEVLDARIVDTGRVVTAAGVSAALDLGLYLCERLAGREARDRIAERMEYPHYDPSRVVLG